MRIAILVVGILLWFVAFLQVTIVGNLSDFANDDSTRNSAALGWFGLMLWLFAVIVVIPWPRVAMIAFFLAAALMFGGASNFPDLGFWGTVAVVLGILSYVGLRQKRKKDQKEAERDAMMAQMLKAQQTMAGVMTAPLSFAAAPQPMPLATSSHLCPACQERVLASQRFCPGCGTAQHTIEA